MVSLYDYTTETARYLSAIGNYSVSNVKIIKSFATDGTRTSTGAGIIAIGW